MIISKGVYFSTIQSLLFIRKIKDNYKNFRSSGDCLTLIQSSEIFPFSRGLKGDTCVWYEFLSKGIASENRENKFTIDPDVFKDVFRKEYSHP